MALDIEIRGVSRVNKGAELMLLAVLDQVRRPWPDARLAVSPDSGPYEWRARQGLYQCWDSSRGWNRLARWILPLRFEERWGLMDRAQMSLVLDASGYAYGDPWKPAWIQASAQTARQDRDRGIPRILLPQAFGPFTKPEVRQPCLALLEATDLVFARDPLSFRYLRELCPSHPGLHQAPDFTNLLSGLPPADADPRRVALIPNNQMIRQGAVAEEPYLLFLRRCGQFAEERGFHPVVVLHEEAADRALAERLAGGWPVLAEPDPLRLKGLVGSMAFVVGSRYHGLINALSQGVPAIGTAWSHKYQFLFEDYGAGEFLLPAQVPWEQAAALLSRLTDDAAHQAIRAHLLARSELLKEKSRALWRQIAALVNGR
jgi:polysaccharide pyruvyl transferase WcaK-like protein